ncbi:hypothetical protein MMC30_009312 [Trapelia coarctata]|nr:hypothetical protein [Trapelia coarctata]
MQSLTNAANAAKAAVFGNSETKTQSGTEPISGVTGSGTAGEPYDAGNNADTTGGMRDTSGTLPARSYGTNAPTTRDTETEDTVGGLRDTTGGAQDTTTGSENTFGRDRGGPSPGNQGPHQTSIANKLDPRVDSDGDGKSKAGPNDFETTTGPGSSSFTSGTNESSFPTGQSGTTGEATGSSYENTTGQSGIGGQSTEPSDSQSGVGGSPSGPSYDSGTSHTETETRGVESSSDNKTYDNTTSQSETMDGPSGPSHDSTGPKSSDPLPSTTRSAQQGGEVHPHHTTDKTGVTDLHKTDANSEAVHPSSVVPPSSSDEPNVGGVSHVKGSITGLGGVEPSVGAQPDSAADVGQKQQGADRPVEEPSGEQLGAIKKKKEKHEGVQAGSDPTDPTGDDGASAPPPKDPNDHSGEPLGTVDHGAEGQGEKKKNEQEGPSEEKGTGEKWVKTSGVAADGGDFDATKPGAGKEAERLLEEKGIKRTLPGESKEGDSDPFEMAGKRGLGTKLKEKLHIGSSKDSK